MIKQTALLSKTMLKKPLLLITLSLTLSTDMLFTSLAVTAMPSGTTVAQVNRQPGKTPFKPRRRSLLRFKVPGIRGSRNLEAGAARGQCSPQEISAVLSPKSLAMKKTEIPVELTVSDRPTFFVNVPETSAKQASFLLMNEAKDQVLLEKTLSLNSTNGIFAYTLPADFQGLEVQKKYSWRLSLLCDPTGSDRSGDVNASGWIERVTPTSEVAKELEQATDTIDLIAIYAKNGYWQDTLKALADLRAANPNDPDLASDWSNLFKSVYLPKLAQQPVIQLDTVSASQ